MSQTSTLTPSDPLRVNLLPVGPLNVPRRQTLSTSTVQVKTSTVSRMASHSWPARPPPITTALEAPRKIRPLPIPPSPQSAPPMPRRQTSTASLRPLPCVPETTGVSFSVTPASPLPPPTPVVQSSRHLSPPPPIFAPSHRFASISLRLDTSPDALKRVVDPPLSSPPPTPAMPEPPTPTTARRKRMSKLRRHLGESVQLELLPDPGNMAEKENLHSQTIFAVKKLLDLGEDDTDDESSTDDEDDRYSLVFSHGHTHHVVPVKRYSRKWVRERGGDRWVEENYSNILRELRAL
ncbi:hypothetical protein R3P38DRAFT_1224005 [Favolaschia claudopus]|uniref:Uncharacterized protein n=1 Tax=Favolaschia claudopus TaxID=2862362 RepID=A0AAW0B575_9AGAR